VNQSSGAPERMTLSQDLAEFLIEFSIALHRTSMYPWGHPSLERAASAVLARLVTLLADRPNISIGVARRQLVIEGVATDPRHPVLRSLASKLHRHHIGAVSFSRGLTASELASMMRLVGAEPEKGEQPLGLGDPEHLRQWANVRLYPLTYEQLQMIDDAEAEDEGEDDRDRGTRSAQLWIGLARAALAREDTEVEPESTEPAVVAQAINQHPQALAYDQVIVGYLLQLSQELKSEGGAGSSAIRRRLSRLIGALDEKTLARLLDMGGDIDQRRRFVLDAAEALTADAVVELVQAAASSTNQTVSSSMVRLLTKLSAFAEQGTQATQAQADVALREQVQQLISRWGLADPNPDEYTHALNRMAHGSAATATAQTRFPPEPLRIVQMAIESDAVGMPLWRAVADIVQTEGYRPVVDLLVNAPRNGTVAALWDRIAQVDTVHDVLAREHVDFVCLGHILDRLDPTVTVPVLVETLAESDARATRMGIYKRLVHEPPAVLVDAITPYLEDTRWYVQRNMLALLNEADLLPPHVTPSAYARHPDPRVRREALQLWIKLPNERERAVCVALADADERALRIGVTAARTNCPEAAVPLIVNRLANTNLTTDLRVQLTRLLQASRMPIALEALLRIATAGRTLFGKPKLAHRSPEMLAAINVIAASWAGDRRGGAVIDRARKSSDPEIRAAAQMDAAR